ncbi:metallophosphoesterase family protein [Tengunoibacter tsumagoiensis]|uniref:Serine/threonine protein phosphatase n=1 Tax=Tengunoibacter tsumagoiensis TaxID=2014871 RepID=A0A401ZX71_9CHLR|nr:metallophosphoesterase family protein [Tengunoibacter tsumagoiensis]GCE11444.1 serine/threonine protein phosphatase [Tengunoibacter tsumagoiensis]
MRLALISDIHGNLTALEAVLADIAQRQIKEIICLGDVSTGGPHPREVLRRIQALDCPVVMGNNDDWVLSPRLRDCTTQTAQNNQDINLWCTQQHTKADKDFIRTFHPNISWPLPNGKILLFYHGSPRSFSEFIVPTTPNEIFEEAFAGFEADIFIGGHSHMQMFRRYRKKIVINPGSIGRAMDRVFPLEEVRHSPWAEYAILTIEDGGLSVEHRHVQFDIHAFIRDIHTSGMPHAQWLVDKWNLH